MDDKYCLGKMKFPEKLWNIVNCCTSGAIGWSTTGNSIIIEFNKFNKQYLSDASIFKSINIRSFIRQLNLYGFKKCKNEIKSIRLCEDLHEYKHPFFIRNQKSLIHRVYRNYVTTEDRRDIQYKKREISKSKSILKNSSCDCEQFFAESRSRPTTANQQFENQRLTSTAVEPVDFPYNTLDEMSCSSLSFVRNGWLPADAEFYNSQRPTSHATETNTLPQSNERNDMQNSGSNVGNLYILVVPGYLPQNILTNQGLHSLLMPLVRPTSSSNM